MTGQVDWQTLLWVIGSIGGSVSSAFIVWFAIDARTAARVKASQDAADEAMNKALEVQLGLAALQLHIAEAYVTKQGMREQTDVMLSAVNGIRDDIKGLNGRIDMIFQNPPSTTRRTRGPSS